MRRSPRSSAPTRSSATSRRSSWTGRKRRRGATTTASRRGALRRLERALELDPDHEKALWIGGFAAVQNGRTDIAAARWERLLAGQAPGSREAFIVTELLARIRDTGDAAPAARSGAAGSTGATEPADSGEPSDFSEPADSSENQRVREESRRSR